MTYLIYLFLVAGISLIFFGILNIGSSERPSIYQRFPQEEAAQIKKIKRQIYLKPIFKVSNFILDKIKSEDMLRHRLHAAHVPFSAQEFFSIKLAFILLLVGLALFVLKVELPGLFVAFAMGYFIPDLWLKRKIEQYRKSVVLYLPETVDLLGLCIEAGLDFTSAVDWIIRRTRHTPVVEELGFVLEEIKWGKPRPQALKDMAKRINASEVNSFTQILVQAEKMGTPVAEVFNILSEDTRLQRFRKGERLALQAPIKMLIPLVFCILPVIAIVIGGPIMLQFMQGNIVKGF